MAKRKVQYVGLNSTEPAFMGLVYDFFADIEDFTVTPTKEEVLSMFTSANASEYPHFSVSYNGIVFDVARPSKTYQASAYVISTNISGVQDTTSGHMSDIKFLWSSYNSTSIQERQCTIDVIYNSNILVIGSQYGSLTQGIMLFFKDENANVFYGAKSNGNTYWEWDLSTLAFYTNAESIEYRIVPICKYTVGTNNIDMYDYIILKQNSINEKTSVIHTNEIFYCSPVTANKILTIGNKKYKSIGTNCIVQIGG